MQLHEIESFNIQVLQGTVNETFQIGAVVTTCDMRVKPATGLGGHHRACSTACFQDVCNNLLRAAIAIDIGCIDERHTGIERSIEGCTTIAFRNFAPRTANLPGTKANIGDCKRCAAKVIEIHRGSSLQAGVMLYHLG